MTLNQHDADCFSEISYFPTEVLFRILLAGLAYSQLEPSDIGLITGEECLPLQACRLFVLLPSTCSLHNL